MVQVFGLGFRSQGSALGGGGVVQKIVLSGAIQRTNKDRRETAGLAVKDDVGIALRKPNLLVHT